MEFIKVGKNYMIKNSNGRIISEKEKLELENEELIIEDIKSNKCQGKTTQKIKRNKKKIKEIMEEEKNNKVEEIETYDEKDFKEELDKHLVSYWENKETAQNKGEGADDTIKKTDPII